MKKRAHIITVRLNDSEYDHLKAHMEKSAQNMESTMRRLILNMNVPSRPCEHHGELLKQLSALSNDAHDILDRLAKSGEAAEEIPALRDILSKTWMLIATKY
jgi:hypothetical protein